MLLWGFLLITVLQEMSNLFGTNTLSVHVISDFKNPLLAFNSLFFYISAFILALSLNYQHVKNRSETEEVNGCEEEGISI